MQAIRYYNPKTQKKEITILADKRTDVVMSTLGIKDYECLGKIQGEIAGRNKIQTCFYEQVGSVVLADYVTLSDGTGCVHTAPGHGQERLSYRD